MKNLRYKRIILLLLILISLKSYSGNKGLYDIYLESLFTSNYNDTKKILAQLRKDQPNHIKTKLAFANFWLLMYETTNKVEEYHALCKNDANSAIKTITSKKNNSYDEIFHLISAKSILLKIQFDNKNYLKAARGLKNIIQYFEYALDHEDNDRMKLISGMYNYYIETVKEDYPAIYPLLLFYPSGDKQKGIQLLEECTKVEDKSVSIRSLLYLARIYYRDEKKFTVSEYYFNKLLTMYPDNLIWRFEYIQSLNKLNKVKESKEQKKILTEKVNKSIHLTNEQRAYFLNFN